MGVDNKMWWFICKSERIYNIGISLVLFVCLVIDVLFYGIGVVLLYVMEDGIECFIVYVFCILIKVEKVYF